jgi:hypothetical protein
MRLCGHSGESSHPIILLSRTKLTVTNSNQVDLRILREMGINVDRKNYEKILRPVQKFRAGVFAIMAAIRMSNMERRWREVKLVGEELRLVKERGIEGRRTSGGEKRGVEKQKLVEERQGGEKQIGTRERQVSEKTNVRTTVRVRSVREV